MQEVLWLPARAIGALIEATNDAVLITTARDLDEPGPRITYANPAFLRIAGYSAEEVIGRSPRMLQGPGTDRRALGRIRAALSIGAACREELLNYGRDGRPYWLDIHIVPLLDDDGALQYFGAIERDVTSQRRRVERLNRLAHEDILTGVANRTALQAHMENLSGTQGDDGLPAYFLMLDLDDFKAVNDRLGHQAGDSLLRQFAAHVLASLRRDDFVARIGGDEFAVVLKAYAHADAVKLAHRIIRSMDSLGVEGATAIGVSLGMASFMPGEPLDAVLDRADAALYDAKRAGKGSVREAAPHRSRDGTNFS